MRGAVALMLAAALAAAACGEKPQTLQARKPDAKAWDAAQNAYVEPGWKGGDKASWEQQMARRAQTQNEYARASSAP